MCEREEDTNFILDIHFSLGKLSISLPFFPFLLLSSEQMGSIEQICVQILFPFHRFSSFATKMFANFRPLVGCIELEYQR